MMRFYDGQHRFYCGVDLHAKRMYLCILDHEGNKRLHRNVRAKPREFLNAIQSFRDDLVVGVECMFTWYWLADLCQEKGIKFILNDRRCCRETMSFYGVAHDRLLPVVKDGEVAVRVTVSTSFALTEADRQIGVWCIRRSPVRMV